MKTITVQELKAVLEATPHSVVLDVRTPAEFGEVHVRQARNEPLDRLDPAALARSGSLAGGGDFYLLCLSGARASSAAAGFAKAGIKGAVVVEGGTRAWIDAGFPAERGSSRVISLERQVRIVAGLLILVGAGLGRFVHPGFYGLSAFVGAGLVFAGVTDFCGMAIVLGRMPWNTRRKLPA